MKIQFISLTSQNLNYFDDESGIFFSDFSKPQSFDEFDFNIISLQNQKIWVNSSGNNYIDSIDLDRDFESLHQIISRSKICKIIFIYPENFTFYTNYHSSLGRFTDSIPLKDMISQMQRIIKKMLGDPEESVYYEPTNSLINSVNHESDFCFKNIKNGLLYSKSKKCTAKLINSRIALTTIKIPSPTIESLIQICDTFFPSEKTDVPDWFFLEKYFDDESLNEHKLNQQKIIKTAKEEIETIDNNLEKNNFYKSILYTTGDELVEVVFLILEEMLGINLNDFEDKKKEDFAFTIGEDHFIGEIKGVNTNIKNVNVSQLDTHVQDYLDNNESVDAKNVYGILIMNHQKNRPPKDREAVHDQQISLAKRNHSLIIDTPNLLSLFEKFIDKELSREDITKLLKDKTSGILQIK